MANEIKPSVEATLTDTPAPAPVKPVLGAWAKEQARRDAALQASLQRSAAPATSGYVAVATPAPEPEPTEIIHRRGVKEEK